MLPALAVASALNALPLGAQDGPTGYSRAIEVLEAGDTADAINDLRRVIRDDPDFGPAYFRLGALLTELDSGNETDFAARREAKQMLDRAYRLMGDDPELLLQYGLLLRKQNVRNDAERILNRAWQLAEGKGQSLAAVDRARFHYALARYYEEYYLDWNGLVMIPSTADEVSCRGIKWGGEELADNTMFRLDAATLCPEAWAVQSEAAIPIGYLNDEDRERMLGHFSRAVDADPSHADAAISLLGYLAEEESWDKYDALAALFLEQNPNDARAHLFIGYGLHRRNREAEAEEAFARALTLLPPEDRKVFHDLSHLLPRDDREVYDNADAATKADIDRIFFTAKDPLYLTEANERRLEHYARLAWAELKFAEPGSSKRGWESSRGRIWVRYGEPWRWHMCCYGGVNRNEKRFGRAIYWSYGPHGPLFTFTKHRTRRTAFFTDLAALLAEDLEVHYPEAYQPTVVSAFYAFPHQLVRFRGARPDLARVEIYAAPPLDSLAVQAGSELESGVFVFLDDYTSVWRRTTTSRVSERGVGLTYRVDLPAGSFRYALEAREGGARSVRRPVARERRELDLEAFPVGALSVSDVLLATDTVRPLTASPTRRDELVIEPLRGSSVPAGQALHLYFEVYGLRTDSIGSGSYRAELAVEDSTKRNLAQRLFSAGRALLGLGEAADGAAVTWERTALVVDGVLPEYLSVQVPELEDGEYVLRIRLVDLVSGDEAETVKRIQVVGGLG